MRYGLQRGTRALLTGGLLLGAATVALGAPAAKANDVLGVDIGPVSVGIGPNTPSYYAPPPTYVAPSVTTYAAPSMVYQSPPTTTYYSTTTYSEPGYYVAPGW